MAPSELQALRKAVAKGDKAAIQAALPEPPAFLSLVFSLSPEERDYLLVSILPALETEEDQWEIIEAAAQDTNVRSSSPSILPLIPQIPASLIHDTRRLASLLNDADVSAIVVRAIDERAAMLGIALGA